MIHRTPSSERRRVGRQQSQLVCHYRRFFFHNFNEVVGASPGGNDTMMSEKATPKSDLGSGPRPIKGAGILTSKHPEMLPKKAASPRDIPKFMRLIRELTQEEGSSESYGEMKVKLRNTLVKCDDKGKAFLLRRP